MNLTNIDDIIKSINTTISTNYAISIWVPSLAGTTITDVKFKPLSIQQQKDLISTSAIKDLFNTTYIQVMYSILEKNYLSNDILPLNNLSVLDKIIISLALKSNINSVFKTVNLEELIKTIQTSDFSAFVPQRFESNGITLMCALPSIHTEFICEQEREKFQTEVIEEQIQYIISEAIINELAKYSNQATIGEQHIIFNNFTFSERKQILNQLPAFILEQALGYILACKQQLENYLTVTLADSVDGVVDNNHYLIQLDGGFFATN